ncbi:Glyoxalase-like domain protein [Flavobacterium sp. ACN2]|mgnify:FL=1|jgi:predicted lactoylglutathione lyase|uniref:VOC family protein n=1 Tax=unclassified Flavobacterium TaxID=196869 RepID=UPI000BB3020A|nr:MULTISPECIES: VOC family protein [unclassified Flavobacterium]MDY0986961.1 VOC family protein [Flavobacterium sp. CFBP9031]PBI93332.1 Glyoxalase-like domain protein [Flavobacterium sp. ACN2]
MTKQIWLNLPVKDVAKAKDFFWKIGFSFNEQHDTPSSTCMIVGEGHFVVMLFEEMLFSSFSQNSVTDTKLSSEVLISIDAESREEVDELAEKVKEAGGNVFAPPAESQGWMYGCGFADLDGHRWNVLFMDFSKLPG